VGDPAPFRAFLDRFRRENPDVLLRTETLPNASDVAREMFVTALEGGADDFDVFAIDVVWAPEFARAGWLADLSDAFPPARLRQEFLPGPAEAVTLEGRVHAVPWFLDAGLLYYRTDLVPRAPRTHAELRDLAREAMARDPRLAGFLWQGRQYEGAQLQRLRGGVGARGRGSARGAHLAGHRGGARGARLAARRDLERALPALGHLLGGGGDAPRVPGRARRVPAQLALRVGGGASAGIARAREGCLRAFAQLDRFAGAGRARRLAVGGRRAPSARAASRGGAAGGLPHLARGGRRDVQRA